MATDSGPSSGGDPAGAGGDFPAAPQALAGDPGRPEFADYGDRLRAAGLHDLAVKVLLAGLDVNPACHRGRLVLARVFYEQGLRSFASRELAELARAVPDNTAVARLVARYCPAAAAAPLPAAPAAPADVVSETDFDVDALELLDD